MELPILHACTHLNEASTEIILTFIVVICQLQVAEKNCPGRWFLESIWSSGFTARHAGYKDGCRSLWETQVITDLDVDEAVWGKLGTTSHQKAALNSSAKEFKVELFCSFITTSTCTCFHKATLLSWLVQNVKHNIWKPSDKRGERVPASGISPQSCWRWLKRHSDITRPLNAHCFFPDSFHADSHNGLGVLRSLPFKCKKRQSWVPNLWYVCPLAPPHPERRTQNKHKSCKCTWSLPRALLCIKTH